MPYTDRWKPLDIVGDGDPDEPHPLAEFFEVAGMPVSLTPDLNAQKWTGDRHLPSKDVSVDLVRAIGKPISRKRFDNLRAAQQTR